MTKLVPIEDRIVVKTIKEESKTKWWIVLPETTKEKPGRWEVVAVGEWKILDDWKRAPMDIKVGDVVHFTKFSPDEIELEENWEKVKYLVVKHDQVLAKENS